jgi:hypothetical protein
MFSGQHAANHPAFVNERLPPMDISLLSATELDQLIAKAALRRAALEPAHSIAAPKQAEAIVNPQWFTCLVDPGTLLQIRHPGLGWLSFVIPPNERAQLLGILLNQALYRPTGPTANLPPSVSGGSTFH